jgi:hypothetical protein
MPSEIRRNTMGHHDRGNKEFRNVSQDALRHEENKAEHPDRKGHKNHEKQSRVHDKKGK